MTAPVGAGAAGPTKVSAKTNSDAGTNSPSQPPTLPNLHPSGVSFMLRSGWADLGLLGPCVGGFAAGVDTNKAKGASLSFTQDYIANNRIWAAQAMGAAVYSQCDLSLRPLAGGGDSGFF